MKEKIKVYVIAYIASFASMNASSIKDEYELKGHPIKLKDDKLLFLTYSLRGYLKSLNPEGTVRVSEIRKKGLTVKDCYELIIKKAGV